MHIQYPVLDWDRALIQMPDYSLLKAVADPAILTDGISKWTQAGRDPSKLYLDYRYVDFAYPIWDQVGAWAFEDFKEFWRVNFFKFVDSTYLEHHAPHINFVEELNEYTDSRMITDQYLLAPRLMSAQAATWVWNSEFRGRTVHSPDGGEGEIPADCRLVVCNSPVGNDIPIEYFRLCRDEDVVLGVRTYTKWVNKVRDVGDFRFHSGRPFFNEDQYGIKVDYILGECGPYDGSTWNGWRASNCMRGDVDLLVDGMRQWLRDLSTTVAYSEGRIYGPGAWFTSHSGDWKYFLLWENELTRLAQMSAVEWRPGSTPPPPPPPPDDEVPYVVVVNLIPQDVTDTEYDYTRDQTKQAKETILQSADDAARLVAPGRPGSKVKVWAGHRWPGDINQWLIDRGVNIIEHLEYPGDSGNSGNSGTFIWPVGNDFHITSGGDGGLFDAPRSKYPGNHEGIDLFAKYNDPIYAAADGVVIWADNRRRSDNLLSAYGNHVVIDHENGYVTWSAHLESMTVRAGDVVIRGNIIGRAGSTGITYADGTKSSSGVHLHWVVQWIGHGLSGYVIPDVINPSGLLGL